MITLEPANHIITAIFTRGRELAFRPLSVIGVEPGAKVKGFQKDDDWALMRFEMAYGKAYAALALGRSSSLVRMRTEERPLFMQYLIRASDDQIAGRGVPRRDPARPPDHRLDRRRGERTVVARVRRCDQPGVRRRRVDLSAGPPSRPVDVEPVRARRRRVRAASVVRYR